MKSLIIKIFLCAIIFLPCFQCVSKKEARDVNKTFTYDVTYQNWISDDKKTSGFDLLIPIKHNPENIDLDSVYFKKMSAKLTIWHRNKTKFYIGRFYNNSNVNKDRSNIANKYYKQIKKDECIVTYKSDNLKQHKKIKHINNISHLPFYLTWD